MNWVPEAERSRGYTVNFPVGYRGWRTAAIRFTPARSGTITLTLMGPWEEAEKGVVYRQEILWDDVRVEGATIPGGGFEADAGPTGGHGLARPGCDPIADARRAGRRGDPIRPDLAQPAALRARFRSPAAGR